MLSTTDKVMDITTVVLIRMDLILMQRVDLHTTLITFNTHIGSNVRAIIVQASR